MVVVTVIWLLVSQDRTAADKEGTGKSACHLRSSANNGCVQVANLKRFSAVTCAQNNSAVRTLMEYLRASASICVLAEMLYFLLVWTRVHARCMKKRSYLSNLIRSNVSNFLETQ